jgi:ATP-dependent Clp protease ATP-binding subunit ClpA
VKLQVQRLTDRINKNRNIDIMVTERSMDFLADAGCDTKYGARPLKRAIQKYLENPLSMAILERKIEEGEKIEVDLEGGKMEIRRR